MKVRETVVLKVILMVCLKVDLLVDNLVDRLFVLMVEVSGTKRVALLEMKSVVVKDKSILKKELLMAATYSVLMLELLDF